MNLENLIPPKIIDLCNFDLLAIEITLQGFPAREKWPRAQVWLDNEILHEDDVVNTVCWRTVRRVDPDKKKKVDLLIKYLGKKDWHTVVDDQGKIKENQRIEIQKFCVNDVDIVQNQVIFAMGQYHMSLSDEKKQYFLQHGMDIGPTHSLNMAENGEWRLSLELPATTGIVKKVSFSHKHEQHIDTVLLDNIYKKINDVLVLKQQLKELQCKSIQPL
jgi:hypothetical protein